MKFNLKVLLNSLFVQCAFCARILVLYPEVSSRSHKIAVMPIVEALAERGHQMVVISPYPPTKKVDNIHEIVLVDPSAAAYQKSAVNWFEAHFNENSFSTAYVWLNYFRNMVEQGYTAMMSNPEFQIILKEKNVDLVIYNALFTEFAAVIPDYLKVPFIVHSPFPGFPAHWVPMGAPTEYASVPTSMSSFDDRMTFFQRMQNLLIPLFFESFFQNSLLDLMDQLIEKDFPDARPIREITRDVSLAVINSHVTSAWPRSLPPNIIPIGALHTRLAKPLPSEFHKFADESENGFIVFTLGSYVPVSSMPKNILQVFLNVFAKLPQRVIWKWEADIPDSISSNVMMTKWLPQQDLFGHKNIRLFIAHGGLMGTQEAIYHSVPMLYLPFGNDQKFNARKVEKEGAGLSLKWTTLNEEILFDAIIRIVYEPGFKGNATRLSGLMRDELIPGKEVAVYWVEHVLRHGGTKHLQVAARNIPFHQRYLLDVAAVLILVLLMSLFAIYKVIHWIVSKCYLKNEKIKTS